MLLHAHISSVDFIWFVFLSHPKFDDRLLFKPGDLSLSFYLPPF